MSARRPWAVALVLCALGTSAPAARAQGAAAFDVQAGAVVAPDTVRVGDPFYVRVRVRAPAGSRIEFPEAPDTAGTVQALDPVAISTGADSATLLDQTATYRVAAWDVGRQPITLGEIVVRRGADERRVPVGALSVFVRSVLPADSALRVPKPARPPLPYARPLWWPWALLAAAIALLLLGWWWLRRRRRPVVVVAVDPYERAKHEFARIDALHLVEAGERGRYVALMVEVLRTYLAARYPQTSLALTTRELLIALRGERAVPRDLVQQLLDEADLVKFARRPLSTDHARDLGRQARRIVDEERAASTPPAPPTEAAA